MSGLAMPRPSEDTLRRRTAIVAALREIVPNEGVIADDIEMRAYESDGLTAYRQLPLVVVLATHSTPARHRDTLGFRLTRAGHSPRRAQQGTTGRSRTREWARKQLF